MLISLKLLEIKHQIFIATPNKNHYEISDFHEIDLEDIMKLNKKIFGWVMYDFANSSFTTIIVTVIYSVYFKEVVVNAGELGTALWGRSISISMLMVALLAPIFGAVADFSRAKKRFLFLYNLSNYYFYCSLYFVKAGDIQKGMIFFIIANFGFNSALVFLQCIYYLRSLPGKDMGKVSGWGWGVGYIGGLSSLLLVLPLVHNKLIRLTFPAVALFFLIFSLFTFFLLKEVRKPSKRTNYFKTAFKRIRTSAKNIRKFSELVKFFISYLIYNDGIVIVISFASIYGATRFEMTAKQLITYFIIAQLTSVLGAFFFGYVLDKIGAKKTISITFLIWICVILGAFFSQTISSITWLGCWPE